MAYSIERAGALMDIAADTDERAAAREALRRATLALERGDTERAGALANIATAFGTIYIAAADERAAAAEAARLARSARSQERMRAEWDDQRRRAADMPSGERRAAISVSEAKAAERAAAERAAAERKAEREAEHAAAAERAARGEMYQSGGLAATARTSG